MPTRLAIGLLGLFLAGIGCAKFGYTDRVLHRVQSPDCRTLAVLTGHTATIRIADSQQAQPQRLRIALPLIAGRPA
jgi:hypothetical protein